MGVNLCILGISVILWITITSTHGMPMAFPGFYIQNGRLISGPTSLMGCLDECSNSPGCAGFDIFNGVFCLLHDETTECSEALVPKPGYKHYRFVECNPIKQNVFIPKRSKTGLSTEFLITQDDGRQSMLVPPSSWMSAESRINDMTIFYGYGPSAGDKEFFGDDARVPISLSTAFPFFGQLQSTVWVHTNGYITFNDVPTSFTPEHFPAFGEEYVMIAPLWADANTLLNDGSIHHRQSSDKTLLDQLSNDVLAAFRTRAVYEFEAKSAVLVTWSGLTHYGGDEESSVNSFQLALVDDGCKSFAIFNYDEVAWTKGDLSANHAIAGYNVGDGYNFYELPFSGTEEVMQYTNSSNIGHPGQVPGRWIVRLDNGQCPGMDTCENYLHKFANTSYISRGVPVVPALPSAERCEQWCRASENCDGVTFDSSIDDESKCIRQLERFDASRLQKCDTCTYWRKNKCTEKKCLVHEERIASDRITIPNGGPIVWIPSENQLNMNGASYPGFDVVDCKGACVVKAKFAELEDSPDQGLDTAHPYLMTRECRALALPGCTYLTEVDDTLGKNVTTTTCVCLDHRCNAFGPVLLDEHLVQYNFDLDFMGFVKQRGQVMPSLQTFGVNLKYSYIDSRKNWAAVFDGSSYVLVDEFETFVGDSLIGKPELTISMWVKLTEVPDQTDVPYMSILNNGEHGENGTACIDIYAQHINTSHVRIVAALKIDGVWYELSEMIPYNTWKQLSLEITAHPWLPGFSRENFFVQFMTNGEEPKVVETHIPNTYQDVLIDVCPNPLCIGRKCSTEGDPEYMYGLVDEIWIFERSLSQSEVQSIQDITYNSPHRIIE